MAVTDIFKRIECTNEKNRQAIKRGLAHYADMDKQQAKELTMFVLAVVEEEVKAGLGLSEPAEEVIDGCGELEIFEMINDLYQQAAEGCYFCDKSVDANAQEVNHDTRICPDCQLKAANLLQFVGADPQKVLGLAVAPRKVQQSRFNPNNGSLGL